MRSRAKSLHLKKSRKKYYSRVWRDVSIFNSIAKRSLPDLSRRNIILNDFRTYSPEGAYRTRLTQSGRKARVHRPTRIQTVSARSTHRAKPYSGWDVVFIKPSASIVCQRRQTRREVMHAVGKAGRKGQRKPRFNENSKMLCRRI